MINNTIPFNAINSECFIWCKEQHLTNNNKNIWILVISLIGMILFRIIYNHADMLAAKTSYSEEKIQQALMFFNDVGMYFLIIWFLLFIFF